MNCLQRWYHDDRQQSEGVRPLAYSFWPKLSNSLFTNTKYEFEFLHRCSAASTQRCTVKITWKITPGYWFLQHNNVPAHSALSVQGYLVSNCLSVALHPLCSLDLAPCDFILFQNLSWYSRGKAVMTLLWSEENHRLHLQNSKLTYTDVSNNGRITGLCMGKTVRNSHWMH
jgi:hypothetical protein